MQWFLIDFGFYFTSSKYCTITKLASLQYGQRLIQYKDVVLLV